MDGINSAEEILDEDYKLIRCGRILGCKPKYVQSILLEMYRKINECDAVLREGGENLVH